MSGVVFSNTIAADGDFGSGTAAFVDEAGNARELLLGHQRAHLCGGIRQADKRFIALRSAGATSFLAALRPLAVPPVS